MRRWIPALAAALLLSACDAGHRDRPGKDNEWNGPEIAIQLPGPGTTLRFEVSEADFKAEKSPAPKAMIHLRALADYDNVVVRYSLDDGPFMVLEEPTKPFDLPEGLAPGTHLFTAYVGAKDGDWKYASKSATAITFNVKYDVKRADGTTETLGGPTSAYGHRVDGVFTPFSRHAPQMIVDRRGTQVHVFVINTMLHPDKVRVTYADGALDGTNADGEVDGSHAQGGVITLSDESAPITLKLERKVGGKWERVPGARSAWPMVSE